MDGMLSKEEIDTLMNALNDDDFSLPTKAEVLGPDRVLSQREIDQIIEILTQARNVIGRNHLDGLHLEIKNTDPVYKEGFQDGWNAAMQQIQSEITFL